MQVSKFTQIRVTVPIKLLLVIVSFVAILGCGFILPPIPITPSVSVKELPLQRLPHKIPLKVGVIFSKDFEDFKVTSSLDVSLPGVPLIMWIGRSSVRLLTETFLRLFQEVEPIKVRWYKIDDQRCLTEPAIRKYYELLIAPEIVRADADPDGDTYVKYRLSLFDADQKLLLQIVGHGSGHHSLSYNFSEIKGFFWMSIEGATGFLPYFIFQHRAYYKSFTMAQKWAVKELSEKLLHSDKLLAYTNEIRGRIVREAFTIEFSTFKKYRVRASKVNVRKGPSTSYAVIGTVAKDEIVEYIEKNKSSTWFKVRLPDGKQGWILAKFLEEIKVKKELPRYPPSLVCQVSFIEPSGNLVLDAEEEGKIFVSVKNSGKGDAHGVVIWVESLSETHGLNFRNHVYVGRIPSGETITREIALITDKELPTSKVRLKITAKEANGFDSDPKILCFETKEITSPKLVIADFGIEDSNGNAKVEPLEIVGITLRIQNVGAGDAQRVKASIVLGNNVFLTEDSMRVFSLGSLAAGEYKDISFFFYTNKRIKSGERIPISVEIREGRGRFYEKEDLNLVMYAPQKRVEEIVVAPKEEGKSKIEVAKGLSVDVDTGIKEGKIKRKDGVAVIIGNRDYEHKDVPSVDYAVRDAAIMKEYAIKALGFSEGNIIYQPNATKAKLEAIFGTSENCKGKLYNWIRPDKSDVFIYYSGHGISDPTTKTPYIMPVDCDPSAVALTAYSLNTLYQNLSKLPVKSIVVVIDACFSGASHKGMLIRRASPLYIEVESPMRLVKNGAILCSSKGNQISSWYEEKKHSLFTYFFLKGLKGEADSNNDNVITVGEIGQYLRENVSSMARRLHGREQTPIVEGKNQMILVRY